MALNIGDYEIVNSSNVEAIGYDPAAEVLEVKFLAKGKQPTRTYRYSGVPASVWEAFKLAGSKGIFLHANIKGKYPFVEV